MSAATGPGPEWGHVQNASVGSTPRAHCNPCFSSQTLNCGLLPWVLPPVIQLNSKPESIAHRNFTYASYASYALERNPTNSGTAAPRYRRCSLAQGSGRYSSRSSIPTKLDDRQNRFQDLDRRTLNAVSNPFLDGTRQPTHASNRTGAPGNDSGSADSCSPFSPPMPLAHCPSQRPMSLFPHPLPSGRRFEARRSCSWGSSHCRPACGAASSHWCELDSSRRSCPGPRFSSAVARVRRPSWTLSTATSRDRVGSSVRSPDIHTR